MDKLLGRNIHQPLVSNIQKLTMVKFQMNLLQFLLYNNFGAQLLVEQSISLGSSQLLPNEHHLISGVFSMNWF